MTRLGSYHGATGERLELAHVLHARNHTSRGECCLAPLTRVTGLVGSKLEEGFVSDLEPHFGSPLGGTHIKRRLPEFSATVAPRSDG